MKNEDKCTPHWSFYLVALIFCTVFVVCITFLAWQFKNPWLMLWYLLPVFCYSQI